MYSAYSYPYGVAPSPPDRARARAAVWQLQAMCVKRRTRVNESEIGGTNKRTDLNISRAADGRVGQRVVCARARVCATVGEACSTEWPLVAMLPDALARNCAYQPER